MLPSRLIFIDTETTGCRPTIDRVTEIGLYYVENGVLQAKWSKLLNPEIAIPPYIQRLTGITNHLVKDAPLFADIADELMDYLAGNVFVAHNARFDYAFIKNELRRSNLDLREKMLCTVKLSRMLFPTEKRHGLDALQQRFNIATKDRHRALADVDIMYQFFQQLSAHFSTEKIGEAVQKLIQAQVCPPHLSHDRLDKIPNVPGVYQFYDEKGSLIYIGKSVHLRERILSHFSADFSSEKEMKISQQVKTLDWIETTGEFGALILESKLIKEHLPLFNQRLRRNKNLFTFLLEKNTHGYLSLTMVPFKDLLTISPHNIYGFFRSAKKAEEALYELTKAHSLCGKLNQLEKSARTCFGYQLKRCKGACIQEEAVEIYNLKVKMALTKLAIKTWPFATPIAIKEICNKRQQQAFHVFHKWCYITTFKNEIDLFDLSIAEETLCFDLDVYQLLIKFFRQKKSDIEIIKLEKYRIAI